jgi:hypothetical protein
MDDKRVKMTKVTTQSMAQFIDGLLLQGITWVKLEARAKAEAQKRNTTTLTSLEEVRAHVESRAKSRKWMVISTETGVRMNVATKPESKPPKAGKPTGRKVTKTTRNGRQSVEAIHPTDAEMRKDERDVPPTGQQPENDWPELGSHPARAFPSRPRP